MANIVLPQNHHPSCVPNLQRSSGFDGADRHNEFIQRCIIHPSFHFPAFNVECLGCCHAYLTRDRAYRQKPDQFDRVYYIDYNPDGVPPGVDCCVNLSSKKNGQIAIRDSSTPGNGVRAVANSRTYQMNGVGESTPLGIETDVKCRKEIVALDVVKLCELSAVYMNYADASLVEVYKAKTKLPSLRGFCSKISDVKASSETKEEQPPQEPKVDVDTAASKPEDMTIKAERSDVEACGGTKEEQPPQEPKVDVDTAASKLEDMTIKTE